MTFQDHLQLIVDSYIGKQTNDATLNFMAADIRGLMLQAGMGHLVVAVKPASSKDIRQALKQKMPPPTVKIWVGAAHEDDRPKWTKEPGAIVRANS